MIKCKNCKFAKKEINSNNLICVYYEKNKIIPKLLLMTFVLKNGKTVIGEMIFNKNDKCKRGER